MSTNPKFIEMLVTGGVLTKDDADRLLAKHKNNALAILTYLAGGSASDKTSLCKMWGDSIGAAYVDMNKTLFQHQVVEKLPEELARQYRMIPLYQLGETVTVAMQDPTNQLVIREAATKIGLPVSTVFGYPDDIEYAIEIHYRSDSQLYAFIDKITQKAPFAGTSKITEEQLKQFAGDQSVVAFTLSMMLLGVKERASDIHIEPDEEMVRVRFRVDGVLHEKLKLDGPLLAPVVSRLKILANLDITEKRRPQDGRVSVQIAGRALDFRMSCVPTIYGEKVVLRILGSINTREVPGLDTLYFSKQNLATMKKIIESPNGVFFVTGPTGSGKTTTLFAALKHLNKAGVNIMTIEDPVEYRLKGVNQLQVNHAINLGFAEALRAFLRQDPDVILVGEVRDAETAKIAAQAALTGHLVLTTMHTNNALQAVSRLIEIGVEPFLVAPSIIGVMAQRLVRNICEHCKEKYAPAPELVSELFEWDGKTEVAFYRGKGCVECGGTGYAGRIAIHEIFIMNDRVRKLIAKEASIIEIKEAARESSFNTMRYDGMKKVLRGLTTIEELDRAVRQDEEMA